MGCCCGAACCGTACLTGAGACCGAGCAAGFGTCAGTGAGVGTGAGAGTGVGVGPGCVATLFGPFCGEALTADPFCSTNVVVGVGVVGVPPELPLPGPRP